MCKNKATAVVLQASLLLSKRNNRPIRGHWHEMNVVQACLVLGIEPPSVSVPPISPQQLRAAYKQAVLAHHPDKGGNEDMFRNVQQAYKILSSTIKHQSGPIKTSTASPDHTDDDDLLWRAFAGQDIEQELVRRGTYRPPADFGCFPYRTPWGGASGVDRGRTSLGMQFQPASPEDSDEEEA